MLYGVILAAGSSKRFKNPIKKQFISINNKPLFIYSVDKFISVKKFSKIILVINKTAKNSNIIKRFYKDYKKYIDSGRINIIIGGKERYDSVYNSIKFIDEYYGIKKNDKILIHDSARPNVDILDIKKIISLIDKYKVVTLGYKINDTIKEIEHFKHPLYKVTKTIDRSKYYLISTPQAFNLNILYMAYQKLYTSNTSINFTDDLQIIEHFLHIKPYILDSNPLNIKITTQNDLNMLKYIL